MWSFTLWAPPVCCSNARNRLTRTLAWKSLQPALKVQSPLGWDMDLFSRSQLLYFCICPCFRFLLLCIKTWSSKVHKAAKEGRLDYSIWPLWKEGLCLQSYGHGLALDRGQDIWIMKLSWSRCGPALHCLITVLARVCPAGGLTVCNHFLGDTCLL